MCWKKLPFKTNPALNKFTFKQISLSQNIKNIVTINTKDISTELAHKYHLVADDFKQPKWWKIVVMAHVEKHIIDHFLLDLQKSR